jgi:hypothetical protein
MKDLRVYVAAAVTVLLTCGALVFSAGAEAATAGSPAGTAVARTAASPADSSAPISSNGCTSYYKTSTNLIPPPDSEAEWTSNPCGYRLQIRVWCAMPAGGGGWSYSGKVKAVNLWDEASCGLVDALTGAYIHFSYNNGATWSSYKKYFTG